MKLKFSRSLTDSERAGLDGVRTSLKKALAQFERENTTLRNHEKKLRELEAKEAKLEKQAEELNDDASLKLFAVKDQMRRVKMAIQRSEEGISDTLPLFSLVGTAAESVRAVLLPDLDTQLLDMIAEANAPFFSSPASARQTVGFNCDARMALVASFKMTIFDAGVGSLGTMLSLADSLITAIDRAFSGESVWEYEPAAQQSGRQPQK